MKKLISLLLITLLLAGLLVGCGETQKTDEYHIVCSVFPIYDWVKSIVGDAENIRLTLLVSDGSDLHSYNASATDIMAISTCDLLITAGGDSDAWIDAALNSAKNDNIQVLRLLDVLDAKGMAYPAEDEHHHKAEEECHHSLDEHFWLSPKAAINLCKAIGEELCEKQPEDAALFGENLASYLSLLEELDALCYEWAQGVKTPLVFADRFPFKYLFEDYDVPYVAAFSSCSADTDASFSTVKELSDVLRATGNRKIYVSESAIPGIDKAITDAAGVTDCLTVSLNSMQSVTAKDMANGTSYLSIMRENIEKLLK